MDRGLLSRLRAADSGPTAQQLVEAAAKIKEAKSRPVTERLLRELYGTSDVVEAAQRFNRDAEALTWQVASLMARR